MISVLRLGHRINRDPRLSTHIGLTARAFSANKIIFTGDKDTKLINGLNKVVEQWGGSFKATYEKNWRKILQEFSGLKVHLTFYGLPVQRMIKEIRKESRGRDLLVIVGGEKVPRKVYELVDYNISVTSQPHSEVAALAVFLHLYQNGKELNKEFRGGRLGIKPSERSKRVIEK